MRSSRRRILSRLDDALLVAVLAGAGWWGWGQLTGDGTGHEPAPAVRGAETATSASPTAAEALGLLATLEVKGRAPRTGYERDFFGQRWADVDRNGCDTRNDVLRRDLREVWTRPGTRGCVVEEGVLDDPYTGGRVAFRRGNATSTEVQIDHVVALSDAWQKGAQSWDAATARRFANDPRNLLAVSDDANRTKGDGDAATWLPPNREFRCRYVAAQVVVKASYRLWVTAAERDAIERVLVRCA